MNNATPEPTRPHEINSLVFELPTCLNDRTHHVFALKDDGPNEFNLVISHAPVKEQDSLADFAQQLRAELQRALPQFELQHLRATRLDDSPAAELLYSWSNNGVLMQQRQTITFVRSAITEGREALMVAATCAHAFNDKWHATYDRMLASMKLRRPWPPKSGALTQPKNLTPRYAFALLNGVLQVAPSLAALPALLGATREEVSAWLLYQHEGQPIKAVWESDPDPVPVATGFFGSKRKTSPTPAGVYELVEVKDSTRRGPLQHRLATVDMVQGALSDLSAVRAYLDQQLKQASAGRGYA